MTALEGIPARRIIHAIADAAARFADADFPPRVRLLDRIVERTGYTIPVVEYALDQLFFSITAPALERTIVSELGSLDALDRFVDRGGGETEGFARPIGSVAIVSSRTTIGVAIVPAVFALCAKCDVLVKDREDGLVSAFFTALTAELDAAGSAARAHAWEGEGDAVDLARFDAVVAFGGDATLARIRERVAARAPFITYGSKASLGYIGRDALEDESQARILAGDAARDLVLYDSEGCLSLHALFVESGAAISPARFAELFAGAVERAAIEFPPGARDARANARIATARNLAAFRAATGQGSVFSDEQASFLAVLDPPASEPPAFLPRTLAIRAIDAPDEATAYVRRHQLPVEALAIAGSRDEIVNMALDMGAHRLTAFGRLQRPPLSNTHGGRSRIADFVRWVTRDR